MVVLCYHPGFLCYQFGSLLIQEKSYDNTPELLLYQPNQAALPEIITTSICLI
jgi:hypothetical protein